VHNIRVSKGSSLSEVVADRRKGYVFGGSSLSKTDVYIEEVLLVSFLSKAWLPNVEGVIEE